MLNSLRASNPHLDFVEAADLESLGLGRLVYNFDFEAMIPVLRALIPDAPKVVYEPTFDALESLDVSRDIEACIFGGLPMQAGFCAGHNTKLDAMEFHKGSEVLVAGTDLVLLLDYASRIENGQYTPTHMKACFVNAGCAVEIFGGTLHFTPLQVNSLGFAAAILLPRETNTALEEARKNLAIERDPLLFARNKWLIAHRESHMAKVGGCVGISGANVEMHWQ